jgi:hypothetical protein
VAAPSLTVGRRRHRLPRAHRRRRRAHLTETFTFRSLRPKRPCSSRGLTPCRLASNDVIRARNATTFFRPNEQRRGSRESATLSVCSDHPGHRRAAYQGFTYTTKEKVWTSVRSRRRRRRSTRCPFRPSWARSRSRAASRW